jgi:indolepyruvate ferredoxin oxidoreductase alpha subunit
MSNSTVTKTLASGNEAIARGAFEAGVRVASAYPGTPSTEILENFARFPGVYAEWSVNEKVALEVGIGASLAGARALVTMKHVGLNVAADPLMTASYVGVKGGLVIVNADDPGMHSSQNEQDNRHYARLAKVPMLEPSDSQEAKDFTLLAFQMSEDFDSPVILRTTTRVAHARSLIVEGEREERAAEGFVRDQPKYVMVPAHARRRHPFVEERLQRLAELAETSDLNRVEWNDREIGVITSGVAYQYVKEVCPQASVLKLGMTYPLPRRLIADFAAQVKQLYVVEELDPFLEDQIRAMGIAVIGKERFPITGELNPNLVAHGLLGTPIDETRTAPSDLPSRPPVLCPGCPHRGLYYALNKLKCVVFGDIGCYTLGVLPPLAAMDTCICMGAGIGNAHGLEKAIGDRQPVVAVIGDSTFVHSGITGLIDIVYNRGHSTIILCDNSTTAMTGHQHHPATGSTLQGDPTRKLCFEDLIRAIGIEDVTVVDPQDLAATEQALRAAVASPQPSVVITRRPCILLERRTERETPAVDEERCTGCGICLRLGCPALEAVPVAPGSKKRRARVNALLCTSCGMCVQVCPQHAITGPADG